MPYLIDGHNLIASMPDIHLDDPEDELQLIRRLSEFLRNTGKTGTVYFDRRGQGALGKFKSGRLAVEFITSPNTADHAIRNKLLSLKGEARNYTVVSSDHEVIHAALQSGAQIIDSPSFADQLVDPRVAKNENKKPEGTLTTEDLQFWQQLFKNPPEK